MSKVENQHIEWKEQWHEDYLDWICTFANAQGGELLVGVNDKGHVIGINNATELLEKLPNKIKQVLGIIAEINLVREKSFDYIQIKVMSQSVPIALRSRYFYRSGSNKLELTGNSLNDFLLKKLGKTWDDLINESANVDDLDSKSLGEYKQVVLSSGRFSDFEKLSDIDLLEKLHLIQNGKLKNAALIMFAKNPLKFFPQAKIKIGKFGESDTDLKFQEVVEGNLIHCFLAGIELLKMKFLTSVISYKGLQRIERLPYPEVAIREMLLNALVHRDYLGGPIQIRIFDDKMSIWNEGLLPQGMNSESLKKQHPSRPRNPLIAEACFRAGFIEAWGRGTLKIIEESLKYENKYPEINEIDGGVQVTLFQVTPQVTPQVEDEFEKILLFLKKGEKSRLDIQKFMKFKDRNNFNENYISVLLTKKLIVMTIPDKPNSRNQKYKITNKGSAKLK
jgi:ATP-dependent DNA helicase RecG